MFFVFLSLCRSIFVPYDSAAAGMLDIFDNSTVEEIVNTGSNVALLVITDDNEEALLARNALASTASAYPDTAIYGMTQIREIQKYAQYTELNTPFIICFNNCNIITMFEVPLNEHSCITQINAIFNLPRFVVHHVSELNTYVTNLDHTIITRSKNYDVAYEMMLRYLPKLFTCSIVVASDSLFEEIGMKDSTFAIFNREDTNIRPFENDPKSLLEVIKPNYCYYEDTVFADSTAVFAAVVVPEGVVQDEEFHESMNRVAEAFPEYNLGLCDDKTTSYVSSMMDHDFSVFPDFAVFNYEVGYFYPTAQFAGMKINSEWADKVIELLTGIENGTISKMFLSEPIPEVQENKYVSKVVGRNLRQFIGSKDKDTFLMFIEGERIRGASDYFADIAKEIIESGVEDVQFGYINIIRNSDEIMPDLIQMPHIEFYKRGSESVPMFGHMDENGIRRFVKEEGGYNIEVANLTFEEGWEEIYSLERVMPRLSDRLKAHAQKYMDKVKEEIPEQKILNEEDLPDAAG